MEFCPECSSMLSPQKEGKKKMLVCQSCGYTKRLTSKTQEKYRLGETIEHIPEKEETVVIDKELLNQQTMPTVRAVCPKCNNKEAYYWQVQTRSGDEAMTTFYRCTQCGQTWREY
ncbi:MAG: transcription factor S [Candidatus Thorarchaeota archaeon]